MKEYKLKAPLSFQGGKQKVAKMIVDHIKQDCAQYVDLCCGSGAISIELINQGVSADDITMVDASEWGGFWAQISECTFDLEYFEWLIAGIPEDPNKIQAFLKNAAKAEHVDADIIPLWLILQAGSFGGKHIWFDGGVFKNASFRNYWQPTANSSRKSPVNPMMPMPNTLLKNVTNVIERMSSIKGVRSKVEDFCWKSYESQRSKPNVVVFIDPPYSNTTGYGYTMDYDEWLLSLNLPENYSVYITDYREHSNKSVVLSKTNKGGITGNSSKTRTEILSKVR